MDSPLGDHSQATPLDILLNAIHGTNNEYNFTNEDDPASPANLDHQIDLLVQDQSSPIQVR